MKHEVDVKLVHRDIRAGGWPAWMYAVNREGSVVRNLRIWIRRDYGPPGSQKLRTFLEIPASFKQKDSTRSCLRETEPCVKRSSCQTYDCVLLIAVTIISHGNETNVVTLHITLILILRIYCQDPQVYKSNTRARGLRFSIENNSRLVPSRKTLHAIIVKAIRGNVLVTRDMIYIAFTL